MRTTTTKHKLRHSLYQQSIDVVSQSDNWLKGGDKLSGTRELKPRASGVSKYVSYVPAGQTWEPVRETTVFRDQSKSFAPILGIDKARSGTIFFRLKKGEPISAVNGFSIDLANDSRIPFNTSKLRVVNLDTATHEPTLAKVVSSNKGINNSERPLSIFFKSFGLLQKILSLATQSPNRHYSADEIPNTASQNLAFSVVTTLVENSVNPSKIEICCDGGITVEAETAKQTVLSVDLLNTGDVVHTVELPNGDIVSGETDSSQLEELIGNIVKDPTHGATLRLKEDPKGTALER